jgi:hypothetical protein
MCAAAFADWMVEAVVWAAWGAWFAEYLMRSMTLPIGKFAFKM